MKKDIFLIFNNLDDRHYLRESPRFQTPFEYSSFEFGKTPQNEIGKLDIGNLNLRILYDSGHEKNCPWCGYENIVVKKQEKINELKRPCGLLEFFAECQNCLARGSIHYVSPFATYDEVLKEIKTMVLHKFFFRPRKAFTPELKQDKN